MERNSSLLDLKGIGEKTADLFRKIEIETVGELLLRYPRTYLQYPEIKYPDEVTEGETAGVFGRILKSPTVRKTRNMAITVTTIGSMDTELQLIWYRMPYVKNQLKAGNQYIFYGKITKKNGRLTMEQPTIFSREQYQKLEKNLMPVYSLTNGLSNNTVTKAVRTALDMGILFPDYLPEEIRDTYQLCEYNYALQQIHFPDNMDNLIDARKRLVFDEFFLFILGMQYQKEKREKYENNFSFSEDGYVERLIGQLPYELTGAQKKALSEIQNDLRSPFVMQRLIQGDVGSGKTIIAFLAMADAAHHGYQSAIMAPTEVLARQHYETFQKLCNHFEIKVPIVLLTGSLTAKQKRMAYEAIDVYPNAMIIGTHALIQEKVNYANLSLVITDEQHRFGVRQREIFAEKGIRPNVLVMSATPIPRTLAIILYGDLDISVVDEVPAKRLPIKNCVVDTKYRPKSYDFIEKEIRAGHQAYIICPLVEESENMEGENVVDYAKKLREIIPEDIQLGILHGKMKPDLKNRIMEEFAQNKIQILISTTVVEVGVNVPNATVMMIENAERFGLAQLHQLRGRVGRGDAQSYCIMVNCSKSKNAKERLNILNKSNDGFKIASEDLKLRGPGDFFGIRQSGEMQFALGDIYQDATVLQQASEEVTRLLAEDPELKMESSLNLKHYLETVSNMRKERLQL